MESARLPSERMISSWTKIEEDIPILESIPRSVPLSVFLRQPPEGYLDRIIPLRSEIPAVETLKLLHEYHGYIQTLEDFLAELYTSRSVGTPLLKYIESEKKRLGVETLPGQFAGPEFKTLLTSFVDERVSVLRRMKETADAVSQSIRRLFQAKDFWEKGRYSDTLFDSICLLIHKCRALEQLAASKQAFVNDISYFMRYLGSVDQDTAQLRTWIFNSECLTQGIVQAVAENPELDFTLGNAIFRRIWNFVRDKIANHDFIYPEMQYAYVDTLVWLVRLYHAMRRAETLRFKNSMGWQKPPFNITDKSEKKRFEKQAKKLKKLKEKRVMVDLKEDDHAFVQAVFAVFPNVPEYMEFAQIVERNMWKKVMRPINRSKLKKEVRVTVPSLEEQLAILLKNFRDLSQMLADIVHAPEKTVEMGKKVCEVLPVVLQHVGNALNRLRERFSLRLLNPPRIDTENIMSNFEKSMRVGLKDDLNIFMVILHFTRSTKELLQQHLPELFQCITKYIQYYIQEFVWGVLPVSISQSDSDDLRDLLNSLKMLLGCFSEAQMAQVNDKKKPGKARPEKYPEAGPHLELLELTRTQLSTMSNPDSEFTSKKSKMRVSESDQKEFRKFLKETRFFADLLRISDAIDEVADQSTFFFKEYYLECEKVSFFPVTASFPVILSEYALLNYERPELTGAIFYPLAIYDDAASAALRKLKSRFLYEEIKAEARICLMTIVKQISDSVFHPIRRFATLRSLSPTVLDQIGAKLKAQEGLKEGGSTMRMGVILQQNELVVLGCYIDTRSMISERINLIFTDEIRHAMKLYEQHGALASIAVTRLMEYLRKTHELLLSFGLPISPFDDILSHCIFTDTPNTFQSELLVNVCDHLTGRALTDFVLLTNPHRLIPKAPQGADIKGLFRGAIGPVMQALLGPTMQFITTEHFRELFWQLDSGAITMLHNQLLGQICDSFEAFVQCYTQVGDRLTRIKDAPIALSCFQIFDRFEGAYKYFLDDKDVFALFRIMAEIGHIFALSEMMDTALLLKQQTSAQVGSFFLGRRPDLPETGDMPDFFTIFDSKFQETIRLFDNIAELPTDAEVIPPFTFRAVHEIAKRVIAMSHVFDETSPDLTDVTTMNGFAAKWSVLDFLFCLMEAGRKPDSQKVEEQGALMQFGEGVEICAAVILAVIGQKSLFRAVSISEKIATHFKTDFSAPSERVQRYMDVYHLTSSAFQCCLSTMEPIIEAIVKTG